MRAEFTGNILTVRAVEDCIRATKKYSEGMLTRFSRHPVQPIQGEDFPSRVLTKYYEVYPEMEVGLDMSIIDAVFLQAGETPHVEVRFHYNYQRNRAMITVYGGDGVVELLEDGIPGLKEMLANVPRNGHDQARTESFGG